MKKPLVLRITEPSGPRRGGGSDYIEVAASTDAGSVFKFVVQRAALAYALDREARPGEAIEATLTSLVEAEPDDFVPQDENTVQV